MDNKDFLILTKGLAVCLVLDTAIGLLNEIAFEVSRVVLYYIKLT